jgi:hypothetical protein
LGKPLVKNRDLRPYRRSLGTNVPLPPPRAAEKFFLPSTFLWSGDSRDKAKNSGIFGKIVVL